MTNTKILRNVMAIAICLAVTTFGAQAQFGNALKKATTNAKTEVKQTTPSTPSTSSTVSGMETQATGQSQAAAGGAKKQPWSVDKDEKGVIKATFVDGVLTFTGTGQMRDFIITMREDERPWAAYAKEITSAVVEEGITYLARNAYYGCENLTSISLPSTLDNIGSSAFFGCRSLPTITLPQKLNSFSTGSVPDGKGSEFMVGLFGQCTSLTEIKVAAGNEKYKSVDGVLYVYFSTKWRLAAYPAGRKNATFNVPEQTPVIMVGAFSYCEALKSVVLPVSCGEIQGAGFRGCTALESITMKQPTGAVYLGVDVFVDVDMSKIKINVPKKVLENYTTRADSGWLNWAGRITGQ